MKGCRVRIGPGEEVNVWNSLWILDLDNGTVTTDIRMEFLNLRVADLMHDDNRTWDQAKISQIFIARDQ